MVYGFWVGFWFLWLFWVSEVWTVLHEDSLIFAVQWPSCERVNYWTPEELRGWSLGSQLVFSGLLFCQCYYMVLQARIPSRTADHASSKACERRGMIWQDGHCFNGRLVDKSVTNHKSAFGREKKIKRTVFSNWVYCTITQPNLVSIYVAKKYLVTVCWHGKGKMWLIDVCISNYPAN